MILRLIANNYITNVLFSNFYSKGLAPLFQNSPASISVITKMIKYTDL